MVAIVAICTAWYVDRPRSLSARLIGGWKHPFQGAGYWESLTFGTDGRFERIIHHRMHTERFIGEYKVHEPNQVMFTFDKRSFAFDERSSKEGSMRPLTTTEKGRADCIVLCAIDREGNLLLVNLHSSVAYGWDNQLDECYIPSRNYERGAYSFALVEADGTQQ